MNWGTIFGKLILDRGRRYYDAGKVKNLRYENGSYVATVRGSLPYRVEIGVSGNVIRSMSCTCAHAEGGNRCKHMAATLIAIERMRAQERLRREKGLPEPEPDGREIPFPPREMPEGEFWYYDLSRMTADLYFTKKQCREARAMAADGTVQLKEVIMGYAGGAERERSVSRAVGYSRIRGREYEVEIQFDRDHICQAHCFAAGCSKGYYNASWNRSNVGISREEDLWERRDKGEDRPEEEKSSPELCVHETALLYLLADYVKAYNPGDFTDHNAVRLLEYFRGKNDPLALAEADRGIVLELEPRLELEKNGLRASFRIGTEKPYVIKNLTELVHCVRNRGEKTFGTRLQTDFSRDRFSDVAQKAYYFIEKAVMEERQRMDRVRHIRYETAAEQEIRSSLELYGSVLDDFFELYRGRQLECLDHVDWAHKNKTIQLQDKLPRFQLHIEKDVEAGGNFRGITVSGQVPRLINGVRHLYFVEGDCLNRASREQLEEVLPFFEMAEGERILFHVGRKHLTEFYYTVLPILRRYGTVLEEEAEFIWEFLPPEAVFVFYLDAEDQDITCRAKVNYGDRSVSLLDVLKNTSGILKEDYRDAGREAGVAALVQAYFPEINEERDLFCCGGDEEAIFDVLERGVDRLLAVGEVHTTDAFRHMNVRRRAKVTVGVSVKSDIMDLEITSEDISREELVEILQSYRRKKKFHRLKNGDFLKMEDENLQLLDRLMQDMGLSVKDFAKGKMQLPAYRALYLDQLLESSSNLYSTRDSRFKTLVKEFKTVKDSDFEVPEQLRKVMRNYQKIGYRWLRTLDAYGFGGILADDMGLGKTLQMIAVLSAGKENALIICPASLVYNWLEEFRRFAPEITVSLIVGSQKERAEKIRDYQKSQVLITSYDLLKRDVAEYENCRFAYQILDEAQYIKNQGTAASKAVKVIRSRTRYALTGTPIENRLSELWSIFDYLMPGFLYSYETFKKELETPITRHQDPEAMERLKKMVSPFILRRLKSQVLKDLPDKLEEVRYAHLEEVQRQVYDGQVLHMQKLLQSQSEERYRQNKLEVLSELMRIRQICCDPSLFLEDYNGGSAKREACLDLIRSAVEGEHKILVFSQFTSMLELLAADLCREGIGFYEITGATPKERRTQLVEQFNGDATPVFLISLKAGGTGLNLTGADLVIHYDPWWNLAAQNQATDRAHRIGQTRVVTVYKLIVKDSIEEKILLMQERKQDLAEGILSGETGGLAALSRDELLALIGTTPK